MDILEKIWAMFTRNGMYSNTETIVMIILACIITFLYLNYIAKKADEERKKAMIEDLGYQGYLDLIEETKKR